MSIEKPHLLYGEVDSMYHSHRRSYTTLVATANRGHAGRAMVAPVGGGN